jgi:hypothetical protein
VSVVCMSCLLIGPCRPGAGVVHLSATLPARRLAVIGRPAHEAAQPRPMVSEPMTDGLVRSTDHHRVRRGVVSGGQ